ncbi:cation:dicarboxylate symporter family transporter [Streptomyces murinus]|uniref:cation:dicarboxylate symporter family transporter n=1 Tax=Streptomyces murinus TaxID=33900 RepID=UPI003800FA30
MVPATQISALTGSQILTVLLASALIGLGLHASGEAGPSIARGIEQSSTVLFTLIRWIMRLAPRRRVRLDGLHHRTLRPGHSLLPRPGRPRNRDSPSGWPCSSSHCSPPRAPQVSPAPASPPWPPLSRTSRSAPLR